MNTDYWIAQMRDRTNGTKATYEKHREPVSSGNFELRIKNFELRIKELGWHGRLLAMYQGDFRYGLRRQSEALRAATALSLSQQSPSGAFRSVYCVYYVAGLYNVFSTRREKYQGERDQKEDYRLRIKAATYLVFNGPDHTI